MAKNKSMTRAYAAWMVGFHRLYLGLGWTWIPYVLTLGGLGVWAVVDFLWLRTIVETVNAGGIPSKPRSRGSAFPVRAASDGEYVAIDIETATDSPDSICSIGYAVTLGGTVVESGSWLVRPPGNRYAELNMNLHGITPADTEACGDMSATWPRLESLLTRGTALLHWAKFGTGVLRGVSVRYGLAVPEFEYVDTVSFARSALPGLPSHSMPVVARVLGLPLNHHDAEADAVSIALIAEKCRRMGRYPSVRAAAAAWDVPVALFGMAADDSGAFNPAVPFAFGGGTPSVASTPDAGWLPVVEEDQVPEMAHVHYEPAAGGGWQVIGTLSGSTSMPGTEVLSDGEGFALSLAAGRKPITAATFTKLDELGHIERP